MKIAIPVADGQLCLHFGHCAHFALVEVDDATKKITTNRLVEPPPHEPGVLPRWLPEQGVEVILAGGMGSRAQQLFAQHGIRTVVGCAPAAPADLVAAFLAGDLVTGQNACDH